ncbi:MAG: alpha/beta hydrolase [Armatimonadota bacterium]|nr:alpha/beta hydrolase [Armatimonadota bacterium]MDR7511969.1 alpha/beta hydrolase [Armatimonadota bacterium]
MFHLADGEGLVFLHGAGGTPLVWQPQLLAFPRARAPELPGRAGGAPEGVDGYLDALRAALPPAARVVAGHSLGGAIALRWALRFPEEVRGLIVLGASGKMRVTPAWLDGIARGDPEAVEAFGACWFGPSADVRLREKSLALLRATPREVLLADLRAADAFDVREELGRVCAPALVIVGAADRLVPVERARALSDALPAAELVVIEGAGHMVMLERPRETTAAIRVWLARLVAPGVEEAEA